MIVAPDVMRTELGCLLHHYGGLLATFIGPAVTVMISSRRFIQIKYPHIIKINSKVFNAFTSIVMLLVAMYHLIFMIVDMHWNQQQYMYFGLCLGVLDEWSSSPREKTLVSFLLFLPNLALILTANTFDYFTQKEIRRTATSSLNKTLKKDRGKLEKIPKRAAMINITIAYVWISFACVSYALKNEEDKLAFRRLFAATLNAFRNLIIARFAFQINEQIKKANVEKRRKWEIEHAMKERDERRRKLGLIHQIRPVQDVSVL